MRATHTLAILELSHGAYEEIAGKLREAGYGHAFDGLRIDMTGIGLMSKPWPSARSDSADALAYGLAPGRIMSEAASAAAVQRLRDRKLHDTDHALMRHALLAGSLYTEELLQVADAPDRLAAAVLRQAERRLDPDLGKPFP